MAAVQAFLYNPGNFGTPTQLSWAALTGQNFTAQHNSPHIDFCAAHLWLDRWVRRGLNAGMSASRLIGAGTWSPKPIAR